jgi:hypothetical protein
MRFFPIFDRLSKQISPLKFDNRRLLLSNDRGWKHCFGLQVCGGRACRLHVQMANGGGNLKIETAADCTGTRELDPAPRHPSKSNGGVPGSTDGVPRSGWPSPHDSHLPESSLMDLFCRRGLLAVSIIFSS